MRRASSRRHTRVRARVHGKRRLVLNSGKKAKREEEEEEKIARAGDNFPGEEASEYARR